MSLSNRSRRSLTAEAYARRQAMQYANASRHATACSLWHCTQPYRVFRLLASDGTVRVALPEGE